MESKKLLFGSLYFLNNLQVILVIPESLNHLAESLGYRFLLLSLNPHHLSTCQRDLFFLLPKKKTHYNQLYK